MVVVWTRLPDVPVIVTEVVPIVAPPFAERNIVLVVVAGFGEKVAVTPLGSPETASDTLPLNPPVAFTKMVSDALLFCFMDTADCEAVNINPGTGLTNSDTEAPADV
jgi:hypothetical protein